MGLDVKPVLPTDAPAPPARPAPEPAPTPPPQEPPEVETETPSGEEAGAIAVAPPGIPGEPPYKGERRVHFTTSVLPSNWDRLERIAEEMEDRGFTASVSGLILATLHLELPTEDAAVIELARRWRRLRAGAEGEDPYRGERTLKHNLRIYPSLLERLHGARRLLRTELGIRHGQALLLNALLHYSGPRSRKDGELLHQRFALALDGELAEPTVTRTAA